MYHSALLKHAENCQGPIKEETMKTEINEVKTEIESIGTIPSSATNPIATSDGTSIPNKKPVKKRKLERELFNLTFS